QRGAHRPVVVPVRPGEAEGAGGEVAGGDAGGGQGAGDGLLQGDPGPVQAGVLPVGAVARGEAERLAALVGDHRVGLRAAAVDPEHDPDRTAHPLTPVRVIPWTNTRWAKKNSTITGRVNSSEPAICRFHSTPRDSAVSWVSA